MPKHKPPVPRTTSKPSLAAVTALADTRPGKSTVPSGQRRLTVNVDAALHKALKLLAVEQDTDMSAIVVRVLQAHVDAQARRAIH